VSNIGFNLGQSIPNVSYPAVMAGARSAPGFVGETGYSRSETEVGLVRSEARELLSPQTSDLWD